MLTDPHYFMAAARRLLIAAQRRSLSLGEFEQAFFALFAEMPPGLPPQHMAALDDLFWSVEDYVSEPSLREAGDLDDVALRDSIDVCLRGMDASPR